MQNEHPSKLRLKPLVERAGPEKGIDRHGSMFKLIRRLKKKAKETQIQMASLEKSTVEEKEASANIQIPKLRPRLLVERAGPEEGIDRHGAMFRWIVRLDRSKSTNCSAGKPTIFKPSPRL